MSAGEATALREPQIGDIWREVDPRRERFICIHEIRSSRAVFIYTVDKRLGFWSKARGGRVTEVNPTRFNGKRGGYAFLEAWDARAQESGQ